MSIDYSRVLHDATIDGIPFECFSTTDTFAGAVVKHEILGGNGYVGEVTGNNRSGRLPTIWRGVNYAGHTAFLRLFARHESVEMVHPVYGSLAVMIENAEVRNADSPDSCEIDISWFETGDTRFDFSVDVAPLAAAEALVERGIDAAVAVVRAQLPKTDGGPMESIMGVAASLMGKMALVSATANRVRAMTNRLAGLPGEIVGGCAATAATMVEARQARENAPAAMMMSVAFEFRKFRKNLELLTAEPSILFAWDMVSTVELGYQASVVYAADADVRSTYDAYANSRQFDRSGNYSGNAAPAMPLSGRDAGTITAVMREYAAAVVPLIRGNDSPIKALCDLVWRQYAIVSGGSGRELTVDIVRPCSVYSICLRFGLPYTMAPRIVAMNSIVDPGAVRGRITVPLRSGL